MERYKFENGVIRYYPDGVKSAEKVVTKKPKKK